MSQTTLEPAAYTPAVAAQRTHSQTNRRTVGLRLVYLGLLTCLAFAILGYHPGVEDDFVYLAAIKHDLNPALFPHDLPFIMEQLHLTLFDTLIAGLVNVTHLGLPWSEILCQFSAIGVLLFCCWQIAAHCFHEASARWAGTTFIAVMLALPVSTSDLFLVDQHLHPRLLATDCILLAVLAILGRRGAFAFPLLLVGAVLHPLMTAFGSSFCLFLACEQTMPSWWSFAFRPFRTAAAVLPSSWLWEKPTVEWQRAASPRTFLNLWRWPWYGWLGIVGPMAIVAWLRSIACRRNQSNLITFSSALLAYSVFQLIVAMVLLSSHAPAWFLQFEPMRFLHLLYLFTALLGAATFGGLWLKRSYWRWTLVFLPLGAAMYVDQRAEFAGSPHIEWPGAAPSNPWLQSFAWIRTHTPTEAYFALDPLYTNAHLEGVHSFRALAERSMLADSIKDPGIVTHVPHLAPRWISETDATAGWQSFDARDFQGLRQQFGVDWILVDHSVPGLACPYHNSMIWVCKLS